MGTRRQTFEDPRHSYTKRLLDAVPIADPTRRRERLLDTAGEVRGVIRPAGAAVERVMLQDVGDGRRVAGHAA
jgi:peptide/nickel transport system ATP-binding protein